MNMVEISGRAYCSFCCSMYAYYNGKEFQEFPEATDSFPVELSEYYKNCPSVLNTIKYPIIVKLNELQITNEEFLLLSAILICNPAPNFFTDSGRNHIAEYQNTFSSFLMQYCLNKYQQNGPSRYADLLSIFPLIHKKLQDFYNAVRQILWAGSNNNLSGMLETKDI